MEYILQIARHPPEPSRSKQKQKDKGKDMRKGKGKSQDGIKEEDNMWCLLPPHGIIPNSLKTALRGSTCPLGFDQSLNGKGGGDRGKEEDKGDGQQFACGQ